jgi:hypothetical protein
LQTCLAQIYITFQQFIEKIHSYSYLTNFWTDRMFDPLLWAYGRVRTRHLWCSSNSINSTHYLYISIQVLYILVYVLRWQTTRSCCQNWGHFFVSKALFWSFCFANRFYQIAIQKFFSSDHNNIFNQLWNSTKVLYNMCCQYSSQWNMSLADIRIKSHEITNASATEVYLNSKIVQCI